ncbi:CPBP family intramembrane glutamic endopeptidase [Lentilactobacillus kisonensis]|nr:CPBP family intramembrane glutamic endopeptidase [Lentilactobacillus kisonensis]EHO51845.1 CAAX amino terminal protease family protein [Lentilactobacillus kisonensis F0435]
MIIESRRSWVEQLFVAIIILIIFVFMAFALFDSGEVTYAKARLLFSLIVLFIIYREVGTFKVTKPRVKLSTNLKLWFMIIGISLIVMAWQEQLPSRILLNLNSTTLAENTMFALAAGIFEESLTRGLFFSIFLQNMQYRSRSLKFTRSALYSALIFGSLHLMNLRSGNSGAIIQQIFYAFALGVVLAAIRVTTNTLFWGIGLHFLMDWQPGIASTPSVATSWLPVLLIFGSMLVIGIVYLVKFDHAYEKQSRLTIS